MTILNNIGDTTLLPTKLFHWSKFSLLRLLPRFNVSLKLAYFYFLLFKKLCLLSESSENTSDRVSQHTGSDKRVCSSSKFQTAQNDWS